MDVFACGYDGAVTRIGYKMDSGRWLKNVQVKEKWELGMYSERACLKSVKR